MLISPPNILEGNIKEEESFDNRTTPLDLAIIGAVLEKRHQVRILDALALQLDKKQILNEIEKFNPDLICLTAVDRCRWGIDSANELSRHIKGRKLGLIWSYKPELMTSLMENNSNIDFSIYGDPEFTLFEVADNKKFSSIKGLIYRRGKRIVKNLARELIKDFDILPFPARHLLDMSAYKRLPHELIKEPNFDMIVSRGCPYQCTFCLMNIVGGRIRRTRSPEKAVEEMKILKQKGAKQIHFQDLTFTMDRNWVMKFCNLLEKAKLNLVWTCQTRVDKVDFELLEKMKEAGCRSILYGIESLDQGSLDNIKKGIKIEDIEKALRLTKKAGIEARCSMMLALPGETRESVMKVLNLLIKLNPAFAQFHTTTAFPGTELYENSGKYGIIPKERVMRKFDISGRPFIPNAYKNEEEILKLQKEAYRKFYFRLGYILRRVLSLNQFARNIKGIKMFFKLT